MGPYSNTSCFLVGTDSGPPSPAPETRLPSPRVRGCYCPRRDCSLSLSFSLSLSLSLSPDLSNNLLCAIPARRASLCPPLFPSSLLSFHSLRYPQSLPPPSEKPRLPLFCLGNRESKSPGRKIRKIEWILIRECDYPN